MEDNKVYENATVETVEGFEAIDSSLQLGVFEKAIIGGAAIATGVAVGVIYKNRKKISAKIDELKAKKLEDQINKTRAKLAKLEAKTKIIVAEEK